ncbi:MAG: hypothetical protein GY849_16440 [Deltaproteobacteria bacterium]|nr:hypothetical protein [Deltaproteobacteria bacterium]
MAGQKVRITLFVAALFVSALLVGHNILIKWAVGAALERSLGVKLQMGSFRAGITKSVVKVGDVTLMSPEGFEDEPMMKASLVYADYELGPLLNKEIHLTYLKLDAGEIVVVKNREGKVNIHEARKAMEQGRRSQGREEKKGKGKRGKHDGPLFKIDLLVMSLGKVVFKDYSTGDKPQMKTIPFSFTEAQFRDVRSKDIYAGMALLASASQFYPEGLSKVLEGAEGDRTSVREALEAGGKELLKQLKKSLQKLGITKDRK